MKWNFILRGATHATSGWATGHGFGETSWALDSNHPLPMNSSKGMGKAVLLKIARELCALEGGRLIVVEEGTVVSAWQWSDAGEEDAEAAGHWTKFELDPREFKAVV